MNTTQAKKHYSAEIRYKALAKLNSRTRFLVLDAIAQGCEDPTDTQKGVDIDLVMKRTRLTQTSARTAVLHLVKSKLVHRIPGVGRSPRYLANSNELKYLANVFSYMYRSAAMQAHEN